MPTPLFIQATLHDGPNAGTILIPYVDALPLEPTTSRALILDQLVGVNVPGLYIYDNSQVWRYTMPIEAVSAIVVGGDQCDLYINVTQTYSLGPTTIVYRNGQLQTGHSVVPANAVYAVRTPSAVSQGSVTSVNGLTGDVVLTAANIIGFAAVAYSGLYSDLIGAPGPYELPVATDSVLGGVSIPITSSIQVDAQGNIDINPALVTKINAAVTDVQTSGDGTSLINTDTAGVVTLKSLAAGSNITITDNGIGTLTVASTGGGGTITSVGTGVTLIDSQTPQNTDLRSLVAGANVTINSDGLGGITIAASAGVQSVTLQGDVSGTGTSTIQTTLADSGVSAGTYHSVTVDSKGRVTAGTNPTTLSGYGITDALPLTGGSMSGSITMTAGSTVTGVPTPVNASDAASKDYVDAQLAAAANGVSWRESAAVATTANVTLSGLQTIDGYTTVAGDRVLVKNQTVQTENGVYDASSGAWTRSSDSDTGAELYHAAYLVVNGTANGLTQWANTNQAAPVVGTDGITFGQLRAQGTAYTAGAGLTLTGQQFSIAPTGVAAGSYAKVTVNTLGQVTGGSTLTGADVNTALGYTAYNGTTNPSGFIGALTAAGDATGSTTISGSSGTLNLALSATGVTAGTYTSVTVDTKGRVTGGGQISPAQITAALGYTPVNKAGDTMSGALNFNGLAVLASAATLNIGAASSNLVSVTGAVTVTSFDNVPGAIRTLVFQGALTLTNNTNIVLPGAANITTAAGDVATFMNVGGTVWRCVAYTKADGTPIKGGGGSPYTTVQIFNGSPTDWAAEFTNAVELVRITNGAPLSSTNFDVQLGSVQQYAVNTSANWSINFRFNSTTSLDSIMSTGMSITVAFIAMNGGTAFYANGFKIDGTAITPKWQGGASPGAGTINAYDVYTFTIIKTAAATFTVLGAQTSFF